MLYSILKITDGALKNTLAEKCDRQPFIASAPLVWIFLADTKKWRDMYISANCRPRKQGAGDALIAMADALIAVQNAVTAAHSLGLGSCYIGDILENCEDIRELLKLPEDVFPAAMIVMGYPDARHTNRSKPARFDKKYIVFENHYKALTEDELRQMYLTREEQECRTDTDFESSVAKFYKRKYDSAFCIEMNRSAKEYLKYFIQDT